MRISVIVPVLDEAPLITGALAALRPLCGRGHELIVVDGGSHDDSTCRARAFADRLIRAPRGRALQMNAGAQAASGDVFLFLHVDVKLPEHASQQIESAILTGARWGRFNVRFAGAGPLLRIVASFMNVRSWLTGLATGDQAIFVCRDLFIAAGGYPAVALMEDIALSRRLRRIARPRCLDSCVEVSSRRWRRDGTLRTILLMWRLRAAYFFGANPDRLVRRYYKGYS